MKKLLLKSYLSPGDIVTLTACVRDLHKCYPGEYLTDVRTSVPALWENNPYITPLDEEASDVQVIEMNYPLIHKCNENSKHFLFGYIDYLNEILGIHITLTEFRGDIHLSSQEKIWTSQIEEMGYSGPFWIVNAGGKTDFTIKWWDFDRYQEVITHYKEKIQFVQVGESGHEHRCLDNVIDLRGRTDVRQLVRLVYHAQGCLSPVSFLMHLAAAVPTKDSAPTNRPCVVIGGGREPSHWEAYPHHQFIHTIGALKCCSNGGCWKSRTVALNDGTDQDKPESLCTNTVVHLSPKTKVLPKCMDMISAEDVCRRIEMYFAGGIVSYAPISRLHSSLLTKPKHKLFEHSPSVGLVIGTFAALPYVHLALESRKRLYPEVPVLVSDDHSPNRDKLEELCKSYGADFTSASVQQNPCVGDMAAYANGLDWAKAKGLNILVKMSRRFIPRTNWVPGLQNIAMESQYPTYSQRCTHFDFGFRTECIGLHVDSWIGASLDRIRYEVTSNTTVFVEMYLHSCARTLEKSLCDTGQVYADNHPRHPDINGYTPWPLMPESRMEITPDYLWHDRNSPLDYWKLSQEYGLSYTKEDFADPNRG